jgi:hypothetical protein
LQEPKVVRGNGKGRRAAISTLVFREQIAHLEEVKELMGEVARVSDRENLSFTVDLGGEMIGTVEGGRMDSSLEVGLIGEWERVLGAEGSTSSR